MMVHTRAMAPRVEATTMTAIKVPPWSPEVSEVSFEEEAGGVPELVEEEVRVAVLVPVPEEDSEFETRVAVPAGVV